MWYCLLCIDIRSAHVSISFSLLKLRCVCVLRSMTTLEYCILQVLSKGKTRSTPVCWNEAREEAYVSCTVLYSSTIDHIVHVLCNVLYYSITRLYIIQEASPIVLLFRTSNQKGNPALYMLYLNMYMTYRICPLLQYA